MIEGSLAIILGASQDYFRIRFEIAFRSEALDFNNETSKGFEDADYRPYALIHYDTSSTTASEGICFGADNLPSSLHS